MANIQTVNAPGDSANSGRVKWNANDIELEARIAAHIVSNDHDEQYYTKAEIGEFIDALNSSIGTLESDLAALDEAAVKLTGAQTIDGVKSFVQNPKILKNSPTLILESEAQDSQALLELSGAVDWDGVDYRKFALNINIGTNAVPNYVALLSYTNYLERLSLPAVVTAGGDKLATEKYVGKLAKSGRFTFDCAMKHTTNGAETVTWLTPGNGVQRFIVPESCRLEKVTYGYLDSTHSRGSSYTYEADHYFNYDSDMRRAIKPALVITLGESLNDVALKLYAEDLPIGGVTSTEIFSAAVEGVYDATDIEFYLTLELSV